MQGKQTVRGAALAFVALVALAVASAAPAGGTQTIVIRHAMRQPVNAGDQPHKLPGHAAIPASVTFVVTDKLIVTNPVVGSARSAVSGPMSRLELVPIE